MNAENYIKLEFPSYSSNEAFARTAAAAFAAQLDPTLEEVKYSDGTTDEANAFDIPVPYLDEDFPCALIGKKGVWYDHSVSVSDPEPMEVPAA